MAVKPNIVWVNLDSIRADHTSVGGYRRHTTPGLQSIANMERGQSFTRCFAHANWSLPSIASMLTGRYPSAHGLGFRNEVLPQQLETIPERLSKEGYYTAGLSFNGYLNETTGLDRGFERFEWIHKWNLLNGAGIMTTIKYLLNLRRHSAGFSLRPTQKHSLEYIAREMAERWLRSFIDKEPFFFFLHTQAAHLPYIPPLPYRDRYAEDFEVTDEILDFVLERTGNYLETTARGCDFTNTQCAAVEAMYDAKIAYADAQVKHVFDVLQSLDLSDTIFIVTSDHGDMHCEYGIFGHILTLHDSLIHVPTVVHGFDDLDGQSDQLVQHTDIVRTVLESAGATTEDLHGYDIRSESRDFALSQRGNEKYQRDREEILTHNPKFSEPFPHSPVLHCLRTTEHKLLKSDSGRTLFELPDESTDIGNRVPDLRAELESNLDTLLGNMRRFDTSRDRDLSEAVEKQLRDLGYR